MTKTIKRFVKEEEGMEFVEYGLIVAVMVLVAFTAWSTLGENIKTVIGGVADKVKVPS